MSQLGLRHHGEQTFQPRKPDWLNSSEPKNEELMFNYVDDFASPQFGRYHETETGEKLLVSARLMQRDLPYNFITHLDPNAPASMNEKSGTLLLEAMDIENLEAGTIGYSLLKVKKRKLIAEETVATYAYRYDGVIDLLLSLASTLADRRVVREQPPAPGMVGPPRQPIPTA